MTVAAWKIRTLAALSGLTLGLALGPRLWQAPAAMPVAGVRPVPADSLAEATQAALVRSYNLDPSWFGKVRRVKLTNPPAGFTRFERELRVPRDVSEAEMIRELNLLLRPGGGRAVGYNDLQAQPRRVVVQLIQGGAVRGTIRIARNPDLTRPAGVLALAVDGLTAESRSALAEVLAVPEPIALILDPADPGAATAADTLRGRPGKPLWILLNWTSAAKPDRLGPIQAPLVAAEAARPVVVRFGREFPGAAGVVLAPADSSQPGAVALLAALRTGHVPYRWLDQTRRVEGATPAMFSDALAAMFAANGSTGPPVRVGLGPGVGAALARATTGLVRRGCRFVAF